MENKDYILVVYIGLKKIPVDMWNDYLEKVKYVFSKEMINDKYTYLFVPSIERIDSEIICINPKYIKNENLIKEHENNMKMMNNDLLKLIKNNEILNLKNNKYDK